MEDAHHPIAELEEERADKSAFCQALRVHACWPDEVKLVFWLRLVESWGADEAYDWSLAHPAAFAHIGPAVLTRVLNSTHVASRATDLEIECERQKHEILNTGGVEQFIVLNKGAGTLQQRDAFLAKLCKPEQVKLDRHRPQFVSSWDACVVLRPFLEQLAEVTLFEVLRLISLLCIAYVSVRQHTSAYVSIRQHTSAYVSIRQHTSGGHSFRSPPPHQLAVHSV